MSRAYRFFATVLALCLLAAAGQARIAPAAETPGSAVPRPETPEAVQRSTPVDVEHEGTDTLGVKLAFQLKELFNASSLFRLTEKEQPKIRLLISTVPEFESRPSIGSAYAVVWVYYERPTSFASYLARETGTVTAEDLPGLVTRLAERTNGLAVRYGYLFE